MTGHAYLAPSSAHIWLHCPAMPVLALQCPEEETEAAKEGTAAHWLAANLLRNTEDDATLLVGTKDPAGTLITSELVESAQTYVQDVWNHIAKNGNHSSLLVETPIRVNRIHTEVWGTPDASWYDGKRLVIWDFKHGHREVSPVWNPQMLCYAAGLCDFYEVDDLGLTIEFRIVQPRCYTSSGPTRSFSIPAVELRAWITRLMQAASLAWDGAGATKPGPYCADCPARGVCPAQRQVSLMGADFAHSAVPEILPNEGLSFELALLDWLLPQLEARKEALAALAESRIKDNQFIPGYLLAPRTGHRIFTAPFEAVAGFGAAIGVSFTKTTLVTPAEAERRLKAEGFDPAIILNDITHKPTLSPKLMHSESSEVIKILTANTPLEVTNG